MATQKAYDKQTGREILAGDMIEDFRGETQVFERVVRDADLENGRSAKILVKGKWALYAQVFPGVEVR